jgi:hypothetical protein
MGAGKFDPGLVVGAEGGIDLAGGSGGAFRDGGGDFMDESFSESSSQSFDPFRFVDETGAGKFDPGLALGAEGDRDLVGGGGGAFQDGGGAFKDVVFPDSSSQSFDPFRLDKAGETLTLGGGNLEAKGGGLRKAVGAGSEFSSQSFDSFLEFEAKLDGIARDASGGGGAPNLLEEGGEVKF